MIKTSKKKKEQNIYNWVLEKKGFNLLWMDFLVKAMRLRLISRAGMMVKLVMCLYLFTIRRACLCKLWAHTKILYTRNWREFCELGSWQIGQPPDRKSDQGAVIYVSTLTARREGDQGAVSFVAN